MDNDCDWICDYCGAYMNDQPGFDVTEGDMDLYRMWRGK